MEELKEKIILDESDLDALVNLPEEETIVDNVSLEGESEVQAPISNKPIDLNLVSDEDSDKLLSVEDAQEELDNKIQEVEEKQDDLEKAQTDYARTFTINTLLMNELSEIDNIKSNILNLKEVCDNKEVFEILNQIVDEKNVHVGMITKAKELLDKDTAELVKQGQEHPTTINGPEEDKPEVVSINNEPIDDVVDELEDAGLEVEKTSEEPVNVDITDDELEKIYDLDDDPKSEVEHKEKEEESLTESDEEPKIKEEPKAEDKPEEKIDDVSTTDEIQEQSKFKVIVDSQEDLDKDTITGECSIFRKDSEEEKMTTLSFFYRKDAEMAFINVEEDSELDSDDIVEIKNVLADVISKQEKEKETDKENN